MPAPIKILLLHHKEHRWAEYIREYSDLSQLENKGLVSVTIASLPQQNSHLSFAVLPERIRRLLFFAKPDLVVAIDDGRKPVQPIFALDVTEHVAARDHWIQRFPNLVGCAQERVPGAFVAPRDTPKRKKFRGKTDPVFFFACDRVIEIHQTPIYIAEWPSSDGSELDLDPKYTDFPPHSATSMANTLEFFNHVLDASIKGADLSTLLRERLVVDLRDDLRRVGYKSVPSIGDFERLKVNHPSGRFLTGKEMRRWLAAHKLSLPEDLPDRIEKRDRNLILSPLVDSSDRKKKRATLLDRIHRRAGDPYGQLPIAFDYLFCRLGPTPAERDCNLIIDLTVLDFADFAGYVVETWKKSPLRHSDFTKLSKEIPIYTLHLREGINQVLKNFFRMYCFAADLLVFGDAVLFF